MKKTLFFLAIVVTIMQACQKKTLPTITSRTTEPSKPVTVVNVKPDIAIGKTIFTNRCGRCHALPEPLQFTAQRWDGILARMMPRARLDKEQEVHVTAFIKENCIK
jgi:cytochrome c5